MVRLVQRVIKQVLVASASAGGDETSLAAQRKSYAAENTVLEKGIVTSKER